MQDITKLDSDKLIDLIDATVPKNSSKFFIVDRNLCLLHPKIFASLSMTNSYLLESKEANKSLNSAYKIYKILIENNYKRSDYIICIGGGIIGDIAGFVASTYMRGMNYINVPSTMLAMIDSSIGGKTGLNFEGYKNIIGSFYKPEKIFINYDFLKTLDIIEIKNGLCEMLKIAAIADEDFFTNIENDIDLTNPYLIKNLEEKIERAQKLKENITTLDFEDSGKRRGLNFGHSLGHAIEKAIADGKKEDIYKRNISHGQAVSIGIAEISNIATSKKLMDKNSHERILNLLKMFGLPCTSEFDNRELLQYILKDKKASKGINRLILCPKIGSFEIIELNNNELEAFLC